MKPPFLPLALRHFATASAACALLTASALAQAPAPPAAPGVPAAPAAPGTPAAAPAAPAKPLSPLEKNFVKNSGKMFQYFVALAEGAKTRGEFSDPKEPLGRLRDTVARDSKKAFEALNKVATAHGEALPTELIGSDKLSVERMGKLKDDKFSKEWVEELVKESKKLDRDFDQAGKTAQDPDLKTLASNYGAIVRNLFTSSESAEKGLKNKKK